jgi:hypothetical protein
MVNMELTFRELWTVLHGMVFGTVYLLAFAGALVELYSLSPEWENSIGLSKRLKRLTIGCWTMSIISWLTVISGTWVVYIWYRANPTAGVSLNQFPRSFLLSNPETRKWHEFGMEWKEHVAWIVPFLSTSIAFTVQSYAQQLVTNQRLRKVLIALLILAFAAGAGAGLFGAFINKVAATH